MTSKTSTPPAGYYEFLRNQARYEKLAEKHLASAIGLALGVNKPDLIHQADLNRAAEHALVALTHCGWELMFDADENFKGIVT